MDIPSHYLGRSIKCKHCFAEFVAQSHDQLTNTNAELPEAKSVSGFNRWVVVGLILGAVCLVITISNHSQSKNQERYSVDLLKLIILQSAVQEPSFDAAVNALEMRYFGQPLAWKERKEILDDYWTDSKWLQHHTNRLDQATDSASTMGFADFSASRSSYSSPTYSTLLQSLPSPSYGYSNFYSHPTSSGGRVTGDSMRIGSSTYHTLRDSDGNRWTGNSTNLGNSTYHTLRGVDGNRWTGDTMSLGDSAYHTFRDSNGSRVTGNSMRIGDTIYHSFRDSNGNRASSSEYAPR